MFMPAGGASTTNSDVSTQPAPVWHEASIRLSPQHPLHLRFESIQMSPGTAVAIDDVSVTDLQLTHDDPCSRGSL